MIVENYENSVHFSPPSICYVKLFSDFFLTFFALNIPKKLIFTYCATLKNIIVFISSSELHTEINEFTDFETRYQCILFISLLFK